MSALDSWSFVVVADPHLGEDDPYVVPNSARGMTAAEKFRRVLDRVRRINPAPQFMMVLGDLHVPTFEKILPEIPLPVHVIIGNHESMADRQRLRELFSGDFQGSDFYTFEQNDALFICLCNAVPGDHVGYFESQRITPNVGQLRWLEQQLERGREFQQCIVFGHVPPSPNGQPHPDHLTHNDARWLKEQVAKHRPTALFFGHRHQRIDFEISGIPLHALRSSNWNFDPDEPIGFSLVTVQDKEITEEFCDVGF